MNYMQRTMKPQEMEPILVIRNKYLSFLYTQISKT